jgi:hypothetical protein
VCGGALQFDRADDDAENAEGFKMAIDEEDRGHERRRESKRIWLHRQPECGCAERRAHAKEIIEEAEAKDSVMQERNREKRP